MPAVVAAGRRPDVRACGCCHRAEGTGGPENANLAGLPAAYLAQQMADFRTGARTFSGPPRGPVVLMIQVAKAATDAEVSGAARYFSALTPKSVVKVVETDRVPKTRVAQNFFAVVKGGGTEPLGRRIIEAPEDVARFELRDSRATFVAWVPRGSLARGEALVKDGGGLTVPCSTCHGADLRGAGAVPGIAGRSPSYVVRQLFDLAHGTRAGAGAGLMKAVVARLTVDDMIPVAAYLASLRP